MHNEVTPEHILEQMRVPFTSDQDFGQYFIGVLDQRITLYSQQVRALNLIYSLQRLNFLNDDVEIGVIGAGAAGLTAATALARLGKTITLFDEDEHLLRFQKGSSRWLHPHIYDWPKQDSENPRAGIPILDWTAASAEDVRQQIIDNYESLSFIDLITFVRRAKNMRIAYGQKRRHKISWNGPGYQWKEFDIVILAIGFGEERTLKGIQRLSYWHDNHLHQHSLSRRKILISGNGDGGLIDLLRASLEGFSPSKIIGELEALCDLSDIKAQLINIENQIRTGKNEDWLNTELYKLTVPDQVRNYIQNKRRHDTEVSFNGPGEYPFGWNSSSLNRFLASLLLCDNVPYYSGKILSAPQNAADGHTVHFENGDELDFDYVIVRHGPIAPISKFTAINGRLEKLRGLGFLDQTRTPMYDPSVFAIPSATKTENTDSFAIKAGSDSNYKGDPINSSSVKDVTPIHNQDPNILDSGVPSIIFNVPKFTNFTTQSTPAPADVQLSEDQPEEVDPSIVQDAISLSNKLDLQIRRWDYAAAKATAINLNLFLGQHERRLPLLHLKTILIVLSDHELLRMRLADQLSIPFDRTKLDEFLSRANNVRAIQ